ncbi:hypothetical protein [Mycolicibacterium smegmatis]|uniref:hypothetical protein n=1 Tax=Mycolicibacterium smegmatis TaxID=1772 RepID=UPI001303CF2C|nr:hypothetical protein [Mycolicibacterium smegmatis]
MAESQGDDQVDKPWYHHVGGWFSTAFRNLSGVRGLTGIFATGALIATAVASWWYTESPFGKFSQTLGFPIAGVLFGLWAADYYYRKDAYKKRYRDVEVSVYTTWLLIAGVEIIRQHIANARNAVASAKPSTDDEHQNRLKAHSEIEAGHTAAELTISMSYLALANFETFSKDAVKSAKEKFTTNEQEATVRQQIVQGRGATETAATPKASEAETNSENGGTGNG